MKRRLLLAGCAIFGLSFLSSCGGSAAPSPDLLVPPDLAPPADLPFGAPSNVYPAFRPPVPAVILGKGAPMSTVRVVPVFFPGDALAPMTADFLTQFTKSSYWQIMVGEYGVGKAIVATPVMLPMAPPMTIDDTAIQSFITSQLDGTHLEWGPVDAPTLATSIYVLYYPAPTSITVRGSMSCIGNNGVGVDAYHSSARLGNSDIVYAVIPRCDASPPIIATLLDRVTSSTAHELVEAATDPLPLALPAYSGMEDQFLGWTLAASGNEIADLCQAITTSFFTPQDLGFLIARSWSNASAKAYGHHCVPIPSADGPGFGAAPVQPDRIQITVGGALHQVQGTTIPIGQSRTLDVQLFSAGPTSGPFTVDVLDWESDGFGRPQALDLVLDRSEGVNGEVFHLTITPKLRPANGVAEFIVRSILDGEKAAWVGTIAIPN